MASRDPFEARDVGGGPVSFQTGAAPAPQPHQGLDFSGIQRALQGFTQQAAQRRQEEGVARAEELAAEQQRELGAEGIAAPDPDWSRAYQQAFQRRSRALYEQQVRTDAAKTANELHRAHQFDPDGFQAAWEEYTQRTVESAADTDAEAAAGIEVYLQNAGNEVANRLNNQVFERDLETEQVEAVSGIQAQVADMSNILLQNPNEEMLAKFSAEAHDGLARLDAEHLIPPKAKARLAEEIDVTLNQNYVRGVAQQALEDDDFDRVQLLVDNLQSGEYFADNNVALQMASEVSRRLGARLDERNSIIRKGAENRQDRMDAILDTVVDGGHLQPFLEQLEKDLEYTVGTLEALGDKRAANEARATFQAAVALDRVRSHVGTATHDEIAALINYYNSPERRREVPSKARREIVRLLEKEHDRFVVAKENSDVAALGSRPFSDTRFPDFMQMSPQEISMQIRQNADRVSANTGLPQQQIPPYTQNQIKQAADAMNDAGSVEEFRAALNTFMVPYREMGLTQAGVEMLSSEDRELGATISAALVLESASGRDMATLVNFAFDGRQDDSVPSFNVTDLSDDLREKIDAMAASRGVQSTALINVFKDIASGEARIKPERRLDSRGQVAQLEEFFSNLEITTLSNGMPMLSEQIGDTEMVFRENVSAINEVLNDPVVSQFFDTESFRPIPVGPGRFHFFDRRTGTIVRQDDGSPLAAQVEEDTFSEAVRTDQAEIAQREEEAIAYSLGLLDLAESERNTFLDAAPELGVGSVDARALFRALTASPAKSRARLRNGVVPEAMPETEPSPRGTRVVRESRYADDIERAVQVLGERPTPNVAAQELFEHDGMPLPPVAEAIRRPVSMSQSASGRLGTLAFFGEMLEHFGGDRKKALAAVAAGQQEIEDAIDAAGDAWLQQVPEDIEAFVHKGSLDG